MLSSGALDPEDTHLPNQWMNSLTDSWLNDLPGRNGNWKMGSDWKKGVIAGWLTCERLNVYKPLLPPSLCLLTALRCAAPIYHHPPHTEVSSLPQAWEPRFQQWGKNYKAVRLVHNSFLPCLGCFLLEQWKADTQSLEECWHEHHHLYRKESLYFRAIHWNIHRWKFYTTWEIGSESSLLCALLEMLPQ